ncbi:hypothetical protein [uncultured Tateyamaria sp.]|uniref:hypothetical protein n=1 Tax=uncultured Tateyamaria sp. TaxID=455651 RepID=UPI0026366C79|nr:hypothetical protein [uncultured Tateyamaria sp.]
MYDGDSFFTLTLWGRIGLVALTAVFSLAALGITRVMTYFRPYILRVPIWFVLFITFVWASPQGYYTYYRLIFDGLPAQSVLGPMPPPDQILALLTFRAAPTLSAHGVGLLGWAMLIVALLPRRKSRRAAAN